MLSSSKADDDNLSRGPRAAVKHDSKAGPILSCNHIFRRISSKLYLHRNEQFLDLTGRMGYKILLGQRTESQVSDNCDKFG